MTHYIDALPAARPVAPRPQVAARGDAGGQQSPVLPRAGDILTLKLESVRDGRWLACTDAGLWLLLPMESGTIGQTLRLRVLSDGTPLKLGPADAPETEKEAPRAATPARTETVDEDPDAPAMRLDAAARRRWEGTPPHQRNTQMLAQQWQRTLQQSATGPATMEPSRAAVRDELGGVPPPLQVPGWGTQTAMLRVVMGESAWLSPDQPYEALPDEEPPARDPQGEADLRQAMLLEDLALRIDVAMGPHRVIALLRWREGGLHVGLHVPGEAAQAALALRLPRLRAGVNSVPMVMHHCEVLAEEPRMHPVGDPARRRMLFSGAMGPLLRAAAEVARALSV